MRILRIVFMKLLFIVALSFTMLCGTIWELLHLRNPKKFLDKAAKVTYKNYQNYCDRYGLRWN